MAPTGLESLSISHFRVLRKIGQSENAKKWLVRTGVLLLFFASAARAVRFPNHYASIHWVLNYDLGFVKRALPGTLFVPALKTVDPTLATRLIALTLFLLFLVLLAVLCLQILENARFSREAVLAVAAFASSPYIVMSAHLCGYFDNILMFLSLLACSLAARRSTVLAGVTTGIGVLVHESILLVGVPVTLLVEFVQQRRRSEATTLAGAGVRRLAILFALPLLAFLLLVFASPSPDRLLPHLMDHLGSYAHIGRSPVFAEEYVSPFLVHLERQVPFLLQRLLYLPGLLAMGSTLVTLFLLFGCVVPQPRLCPAMWLAFGVCAVPLALHAFAHDTARIWTLPSGVAIITLWVMRDMLDEWTEAGTRPLFWAVAVVVIAGNLLYEYPLMDNAHVLFAPLEIEQDAIIGRWLP